VLEHDWAPMQERLDVMFGTVRTALLDRFRDLDGQIGVHPTVADLYFFGSLSLWRDLSQDEHGLVQVAVVVGSDVPQGPVKASLVFDQDDPGKAVFEMSTRDVGTIGRIEHPIVLVLPQARSPPLCLISLTLWKLPCPSTPLWRFVSSLRNRTKPDPGCWPFQ